MALEEWISWVKNLNLDIIIIIRPTYKPFKGLSIYIISFCIKNPYTHGLFNEL